MSTNSYQLSIIKSYERVNTLAALLMRELDQEVLGKLIISVHGDGRVIRINSRVGNDLKVLSLTCSIDTDPNTFESLVFEVKDDDEVSAEDVTTYELGITGIRKLTDEINQVILNNKIP